MACGDTVQLLFDDGRTLERQVRTLKPCRQHDSQEPNHEGDSNAQRNKRKQHVDGASKATPTRGSP